MTTSVIRLTLVSALALLAGCADPGVPTADCPPGQMLLVTVENGDLTANNFTVRAILNGHALVNENFTAGSHETHAMQLGRAPTPYEFQVITQGVTSTHTIEPGCEVNRLKAIWNGTAQATTFIEA